MCLQFSYLIICTTKKKFRNHKPRQILKTSNTVICELCFEMITLLRIEKIHRRSNLIGLLLPSILFQLLQKVMYISLKEIVVSFSIKFTDTDIKCFVYLFIYLYIYVCFYMKMYFFFINLYMYVYLYILISVLIYIRDAALSYFIRVPKLNYDNQLKDIDQYFTTS